MAAGVLGGVDDVTTASVSPSWKAVDPTGLFLFQLSIPIYHTSSQLCANGMSVLFVLLCFFWMFSQKQAWTFNRIRCPLLEGEADDILDCHRHKLRRVPPVIDLNELNTLSKP